jgi:hypothetical protein
MARLDSLLEILGPGWIDALGTRMTQTTFKFLASYANPHQVKRLGAARLARWFQHHSRKAWGPERAGAIIAAAEATLAIWGNDGLDFEALAADIAAEASIALEVSEQIALLDRRIHDLYLEIDPDGIVRSAPGVGNILAGQILGRLGDPTRFTSLAAARSFSGLIPKRNASGLTDHAGGPTKRGDACLRAALFQAADRARKVDPTLAARYQKLMCDTGRHHNSATCTIAAVLLTRIVACLRNGTARVALVEDEVEHAHHRAHVAGTTETGPTDRALGTADALRHGALGHEVGLCDLAGGEAAHRPEGQGDR